MNAVHLRSALALSLTDLGDRRILALVGQSLALTLAILLALGALLLGAAQAAAQRWLPPLGDGQTLLTLVMILLLLVALGLMFRAVAMLVIGLFGDAIVAAVEARHYPAAHARAVPVGMAAGLAIGGRSLLRFAGFNLLASPLYILLLVTGVGTLALALLVNALLLGRDLDAMVSSRHPDAAPLGRADRWALGGVAAAAFVIPLVNLVAPVLMTAMAVHMVHGRGAPGQGRT